MIHSDVVYPDIVVRIQGSLYAIGSQHVISIMRIPKYKPVPAAAKGILGITSFQGSVISLLDVRVVFDMPTLKQEFEAFVSMLDARKQDHVRWVEELESSIKNGTEFTLTRDPHQCAFGKWYDNFHSDSQTINFQLHKIEEPHRMLHEAAVHVDQCRAQMQGKELEEYLDKYMVEVKDKYVKRVLYLLDETKEVFHEDMKEMVVVVGEEHPVGIVVDEVLSVEGVTVIRDSPTEEGPNMPSYISSVCQWEHSDELILKLDEKKLSLDFGELEIEEEQELQIN